MRHSPTAYKYAHLSTRGFYRDRSYRTCNTAHVQLQSAKAFGLKVVQRSAFMADVSVPKAIKRALPTGAWVLYCPTSLKTLLLAGDHPATLCAMACDVLNHRSAEA